MKSTHRNSAFCSRAAIAALVMLSGGLAVSLTPALFAAKPPAALPLTEQQIPQFALQNKLTPDQVKILEADLAVITADQAKLAADQQKVDQFKATMSPAPAQRKPNELTLMKLTREVQLDKDKLKLDQAAMVAQQTKWTLPPK